MNFQQTRNGVRSAVTLIEVIFSIGVILTGLLGLLSILPLAGKRAQESVGLSVAPVLASNVQADIQAEKFFNSSRLRSITTSNGRQPTWLAPEKKYTVISTGERTQKADDDNVTTLPITQGQALTETEYIAVVSETELGYRTIWDLQSSEPGFLAERIRIPSFCIDPLYASLTNAPSAAETQSGCYGGCFPYYKQTDNPLVDPSTQGATGVATTRQPRMFRVGVTVRSTNALKPFRSVTSGLRLTERQDDLSLTRPTDKTLPAQFGVQSGMAKVTSDGLVYDRRIPSGEYTWIATVNPLPGGVYASVSVVILRKRVRAFNKWPRDSAPETPNGNPIDERVAYVSYANGFQGGAGGVVHLVSNANTVSNLKSGDWLMLSRFSSTGLDSNTQLDAVIDHHRWYRVVNVGSQAERLPNSPWGDVWRHKVTLDGPDWNFSSIDDQPDNVDADPGFPPTLHYKSYLIPDASGSSIAMPFSKHTVATLVEGVVSVTERTIKISDL